MDTRTRERDQVQNLINHKLAELFYGITEVPIPQRPANLELVPYYQPQPSAVTYQPAPLTRPLQSQPPISIDYYQPQPLPRPAQSPTFGPDYYQPQPLPRRQSRQRRVEQEWAEFYAALTQRSYAQVVEPAARLKHPLESIGIAPLFEERRLHQGANSLWLLMPLESDPLMAAHEEFRIPKYQLKVINRLHKGGVAPDRLYIAHELPFGSVSHPDQVTADMIRPAAPPAALKMARRLGLAGAITLQAAAAPVAMAGVVGNIGLRGAKFIASHPIILDPILFGVVVGPNRTPHAGELAQWFELLRWQA